MFLKRAKLLETGESTVSFIMYRGGGDMGREMAFRTASTLVITGEPGVLCKIETNREKKCVFFVSIHHTGSGELDITSVGKQKQATQGGTGHHSESEISASKKKIVRFGQGEGRSLEEDAEWSEPQVKDSGVDTGSSTTLNEEHSLASKVRSWPLVSLVTWLYCWIIHKSCFFLSLPVCKYLVVTIIFDKFLTCYFIALLVIYFGL